MANIARKRFGAFGLAMAASALATLPAFAQAHIARFDYVAFSGSETLASAPAGTYRNPILPGYYPDPSITKVGQDFYLVNSTFSWFPGIPVWHSRDLVHWAQIGNAIDRPEQLDFSGLRVSEGVFAPAISHHLGLFYIVNTCVGCGGNYVITAKDPKGPWSKPAWLKNVGGIDPSLFFDDDGSAWLVNNDLPKGSERYPGHRAIWLRRFDLKTLQALGPGEVIADGGPEPERQPIWIEGPHLFKRDGAYYLLAAEGGTDENHSEVVFRANRVAGPYEAAPPSINPVLTQRDLPADRPRPVTTTGHAELVRLDDGNWWAVFLGTRPYTSNLYNAGRETFLLPVHWQNGWPVILPHHTPLPTIVPLPPLATASQPQAAGQRDEFNGKSLSPSWVMLRTPHQRWWGLDRGALLLPARSERIGDGKQPSFLGRRQQQADQTISTSLRFTPAQGEEAGLAAVQNDNYFLAVGLTRMGGKAVVRVTRRAGLADPVEGRVIAAVPVPAGPLALRIHARGGRYDFDYALKQGQWRKVAYDVDATNLSSAVAGGFVGTLIGPFAQSSRGASARPAPEEPYHLGQRVDGSK